MEKGQGTFRSYCTLDHAYTLEFFLSLTPSSVLCFPVGPVLGLVLEWVPSVRFVRVGAEQEVNLSGAVRDTILVTEITRYGGVRACLLLRNLRQRYLGVV